MPARTNVRLFVGNSIYKSCTTFSSQLGTILRNMTVDYTEDFKFTNIISQRLSNTLRHSDSYSSCTFVCIKYDYKC